MRSCGRLLRLVALASLALISLPSVAAQGHRIVTLAPNLAELVYAAGAGEQLVGVVQYSDYPSAVGALPRVGDAFRIDYEALRLLRPDVVLAWASGTPRGVIDKLHQLDYRVVELDAQTLDGIADELEQIGVIAGTRSLANAAAQAFRDGVVELRAGVKSAGRPRVFYQISAAPYYTVSGQHVISELIELCGGENVFAALPELAPSVSLEAVLRANPDVILAATTDGDDKWQAVWQRWSFVTAVRKRALYSVNANWVSRSTPRILAAGRQICGALQAARAVDDAHH